MHGLQEDVRSAAVGARRTDRRRQGPRSGTGALRNLWQNMFCNNAEGQPSGEGTPGFQVSRQHLGQCPASVTRSAVCACTYIPMQPSIYPFHHSFSQSVNFAMHTRQLEDPVDHVQTQLIASICLLLD